MPATPYIISVQVALVAASAAYLRVDPARTGESVDALPEAVASSSRNYAAEVSGQELMTVPQLPSHDLVRFAPIEKKNFGNVPELRSMGFRPGDLERNRGAGALVTAPERTDDGVVKAVPFDPSQQVVEMPPASAAALSAVASEEPPDLVPIPDGSGYSITADAATNFDLDSRTVVFSGNVSLHSAEFEMKADRLVVYMEGEAKAMTRMIANGNVEVMMMGETEAEQYRGYAEEAEFEPGGNSVRMVGWPRILSLGREHRAASASTVMTLFTKPARLETSGRAQTRILQGN